MLPNCTPVLLSPTWKETQSPKTKKKLNVLQKGGLNTQLRGLSTVRKISAISNDEVLDDRREQERKP